MNETIGEALMLIAEKTGQGMEYMYPLLIRAQVVLGVRDAIVPLIAAIIGCYIGVRAYRVFKEDDEAHSTGGDVFVALVVGAASIFLIGGLLWLVFDGIIRATNPEYWAVKEILMTVRR